MLGGKVSQEYIVSLTIHRLYRVENLTIQGGKVVQEYIVSLTIHGCTWMESSIHAHIGWKSGLEHIVSLTIRGLSMDGRACTMYIRHYMNTTCPHLPFSVVQSIWRAYDCASP